MPARQDETAGLTRRCVVCGRPFVITAEQRAFYEAQTWPAPRRCGLCRKALRELRRTLGKGALPTPGSA